jgi:hypothetical protein
MAQLSTKIKEYAKANGVADVNFLEDVLLQDDGSGAYIKEWNLNIAQPTDEQVASYEDAANTTEANFQNEEADKQAKRASGKQKLLDLGLTEEEVKALIGV